MTFEDRFNNFLNKAKEIHNNKYDYSLVKYKNSDTKIIIVCPNHGEFLKAPNHHLDGQGCQKCGFEYRAKNNSNSLNKMLGKFISIHGNKYDYTLVNYKTYEDKIKIICPKHGIFELTPKHHIFRKQGCRLCGNKKISELFSKTTKDFIQRAKVIHGELYDYSLTEYIKNNTKVKIICKEHGIFEQIPTNHLKGKGCSECSYIVRTNHYRELNPTLFIEKANLTHGNIYDYSQMNYNTCKENIKIICSKHGEFYQSPDSHVQVVLKQKARDK